MAGFFIWMRNNVGTLLALLVCLMAVAGIAVFILAFQPCRFAPEAGATWQYQLTTELYRYEEDGELGDCEARLTHDLDMLCLNGDNDIALVTAEKSQRRQPTTDISRLQISPRGQVSRYVNDELINNSGQLVGHFFDFNLFPLPEGLEQSWTMRMVYGILPPQKNPVIASVKRVRNGSHPRFQLSFPPVAWVRKGPQDYYSQISQFRCDYTFDVRRGVIEEALISFVYARERPHPENIRQYQVKMLLNLKSWSRFEDPIALRDMALKAMDMQNSLNANHDDQVKDILRQIESAPGALHPALMKIYNEARRESGVPRSQQRPAPQQEEQQRQPQQQTATPRQRRYALQIASISKRRRSAADAEIKKLHRQGFDAFVAERNNYLIICVGPFLQKRQDVYKTFRDRSPDNPPLWVSLRQ